MGTIKCKSCGATLKYEPGTTKLICEYCGAENIIEEEKTGINEYDFNEALNKESENKVTQDVRTVRCKGCGAIINLDDKTVSKKCPYCSTPLILEDSEVRNLIKPEAILPFKITQKQAIEKFRNWIKKLWFAPNDLKKYYSTEKITGCYMPYWTFDSNTLTYYTGKRGEYYYTTETFTNSEGKTETRRVRNIRWYPVEGQLKYYFDDVPVCATKSLPLLYIEKLEPWNFKDLKPFNTAYLQGFESETYTVDVKEGFTRAKLRMDATIKDMVRQNIGGDEQRISSLATQYNEIKHKLIFLPIWISAYRYNNKVYRFLVNGDTGEIQGERPYSFWKIFFTVLLVIAVIGAIIFFLNH